MGFGATPRNFTPKNLRCRIRLLGEKLTYLFINKSISSSTVPIPAIPKVSTNTFATFGDKNAGKVGPR